MTRKFSGDTLVIATHNTGKMAEIKALFADASFKIVSAADFDLPSPEETGTTFLENATLKALFVAKATGKPALSDDSGLCVNALSGAPGVYSADWAEIEGGRDFNLAIQKVLEKMGDATDKGAEFVSCLVLAWPDGHVESVEGRAKGNIANPPRGKEGHGYDPIFEPEGHAKTYAEMGEAAKNEISHRALAFQMMMDKCFR